MQTLMNDVAGFPRTLHDLSPSGVRLCLRVRRFLTELGFEGDDARSLTVAFSGGADSSALAVVLRCLGFKLVLAHLDHGLRPESATEAEHARRFGAALGVPCLCRRVDVAALAREQKIGLEEAGRTARYAFLEQVRRECGAALIALGHQADDLCEDVLLRLLRGAGWPALGGMKALVPERRLVRPLLEIRHEELTAFLQETGIPWIEDPSNADNCCRRNRLRNRVLPLLREENPALTRTLKDLHRLAQDDDRYWEAELSGILCRVEQRPALAAGGGIVLFLPHEALRGRPRAVRLRVYRALVARADIREKPAAVRARTLFRLDEAWLGRRNNTRFQLPGGAEIILTPQGLECVHSR